MELPIKFDLSNLSATGTAQVIFPWLPGGILVLGACVIRADLTSRFFGQPYLGYFAKIAILLFVAYVLGLFLAMSVVGVVGGLGGLIGEVIGTTFAWRWKPWEDSLWRETAKRFIGAEFTPILERPVPASLLQQQFQATTPNLPSGTLPLEEMKRRLNILNEQGKRHTADFEWSRSFWTLEAFFAFPDFPTLSLGTYMSQATHCAAWAVMILMYWGPFHHPAAWAICWLTVLSSFLEYLFLIMNPKLAQANANRQTAAMLRLLTQRSAPPVTQS
jgi:hypothetical protein